MKDIKMIPIVFYFTWAISNAVKENDLVLLKWPPKVESESSKNKLHWQIQQSACALCTKKKSQKMQKKCKKCKKCNNAKCKNSALCTKEKCKKITSREIYMNTTQLYYNIRFIKRIAH